MKRLVLVVDDQKDVLDVMTKIIESLGYSAMGVNGGAKALEILKKKKIDLVITDLVMPQMDGLNFVKQIRKLKVDTPIIITAGVDISESKVDLEKCGANDFIKKPFIIGDIGHKVEKYLRANSQPAHDENIVQ